MEKESLKSFNFMTKFILHGGSTSTPNELNGKFFSEITKDVPEGGRVLIVYFSRKEEDYDKLFEQDKSNFLNNTGGKKLKLIIASKEQFVSQIKEVDAVYMRGGDTSKLLKVLKQNPSFEKVIRNKTVAGSSAGAYVLSRYFFSRDTNNVHEGLGVLPIKIACHYEDQQVTLNKLKEYGDNLEIILLKDYEFKIFNQ